MTIKCVELFAGAGLLGGGFHQAGFQTVFAAELDERAVKTYNSNLEPVAEVWDVQRVKRDLSYDILVAGPPCQGFSTLGKRDPKDLRNSLSLSIHKWSQSHNPKVVVIENVPQFLDSEYWKLLTKKFERDGYECTSWILNAADYGVAQIRHRSFTIYSKMGAPNKPRPSKRIKTVREAFKGLPRNPNGKNFHIAPAPTELGLARMEVIPKNGDKRDVMRLAPELCPPSWFKMGEQAVDVWGRMNWDRPSNTLRCAFQSASKGRYLHPEKNRVISIREGARIQGIPDEWVFFGDRSSMARQIGNGVPVPLAKAVAKSVKKLFDR